jgi:tripartite-type tricarboxylate transporter receptor subunit TctC
MLRSIVVGLRSSAGLNKGLSAAGVSSSARSGTTLRAGLIAALALVAGNAYAATYPAHPVKIVVPFGPGGYTDVVARVLAQNLTLGTGQSFIVENRPGAGSTIGTDYVAKSKPDGYTLVMISTTHVISPSLYKHLPYDPLASFAPVSKLAQTSYVLVVNNKVKANNVKEFIALAKAQPGSIRYASSGNGSSQQLMGGLFISLSGAPLKHVPYRSSAMAMTDVLGGFVESSFAGIPNVLSLIQSGQVRALGVTTAQRNPELPNVPTLEEAGVPGYDASVWLALLAPAGTPADVVTQLNAEVARALTRPDAVKALANAGVDVSLSTPAGLKQYMDTERVKWSKVAKDAGITIN